MAGVVLCGVFSCTKYTKCECSVYNVIHQGTREEYELVSTEYHQVMEGESCSRHNMTFDSTQVVSCKATD